MSESVAIALVCPFRADAAPGTGGFRVGRRIFRHQQIRPSRESCSRPEESSAEFERGFFIRRIRRLAPALAVVLLTCLAEAFAGTPEIRTFDLAPMLCRNSGTCLMFVNGRPLYFDTSHLSVVGAYFVAPAFDPIFTLIAVREKVAV